MELQYLILHSVLVIFLPPLKNVGLKGGNKENGLGICLSHSKILLCPLKLVVIKVLLLVLSSAILVIRYIVALTSGT